MPRPKKPNPAYQFHLSGQAFVNLGQKRHYLGKHGSPESWAKYHALLAEYVSNGMEMPDPVCHELKAEYHAELAIQIRHVTADFRARELPRYESNDGAYFRFVNLLTLLEEKRGTEDPADFGPRKLEALRDGFIEKGNSRRYCNELVRLITQIVKHGVARELVPSSVMAGLECLLPLRVGQAKDNARPMLHRLRTC